MKLMTKEFYGTLTTTTVPVLNETVSYGNENVLQNSQNSRTRESPIDGLVS